MAWFIPDLYWQMRKCVGCGVGQDGVGALCSVDGKGSKVTPVYTQSKSYDIDTFAVQVGAFTVKANAERLAQDIRAQYGFARVIEGWVDGTRYYRVWVGQFASLEKAESIKVNLGGGFVVAIEK